jgi:hypothetical protein
MMRWFDINEQDDRALEAFMKRVASLPLRHSSIDPMQIWWKAQLLRRWDAERKVVAPLDLMQPVEVAAGLVCVALLLYRVLPHLF